MSARRRTADDASLVADAQRGDREALEELLRRHVDRLHAVCRRLAGNDADAQDATQQALIAVVRGLPRFDGASAFSTWAYRVATNACLDELRRRARRPTPVAPDEPPAAFDVVDRSPGPEQRVVDRLVLDRALADLPDEFRAAVVLRDVAGLDYREIGEVLDLPPGTVRSRISRGRRLLARAVGNPSSDPNVPSEAP